MRNGSHGNIGQAKYSIFFYVYLRNLNISSMQQWKISKYVCAEFLNFLCTINYLSVYLNAAYKNFMLSSLRKPTKNSGCHIPRSKRDSIATNFASNFFVFVEKRNPFKRMWYSWVMKEKFNFLLTALNFCWRTTLHWTPKLLLRLFVKINPETNLLIIFSQNWMKIPQSSR